MTEAEDLSDNDSPAVCFIHQNQGGFLSVPAETGIHIHNHITCEDGICFIRPAVLFFQGIEFGLMNRQHSGRNIFRRLSGGILFCRCIPEFPVLLL
ncbi:hypothetical protein IYV58_28190 (plasmid) [Klebsiella sp. BDA134-6]|uniref:hypothetical protein n=1 Tax=Klebsiella sp. BDA134-6 TaxID=2787706 RepID=UPI0018A0F804|nr:hypothetical protein [Klebsiella sp. BDA134-6]QPF30555.1 hypothetical protein IYV58_28190 [Klebsiella sp. BDA134-6]